MSTLHSVDPGATQTLEVTVSGDEVYIAVNDQRTGGGSIHVSTAELFAALGAKTEWGIRYEAPNPPFPTDATHTIAMPDRAHAQAAIQTGAPLRATNRRIVRRYTSDWEEVA